MDYYDYKDYDSEDTYYLTDEEGSIKDDATIRNIPEFDMEELEDDLQEMDDWFEEYCIQLVLNHLNDQRILMYDVDKEEWVDQFGFTENEWNRYRNIIFNNYIYNVDENVWQRIN